MAPAPPEREGHPGDRLSRGRLPKRSVANVSQVIAVDRDLLVGCVAKLPRAKLQLILAGIDAVLGR